MRIKLTIQINLLNLDTTLVAEDEEDNSPIVTAELNTEIEERDGQNKKADIAYWDSIAGKADTGRSDLALSLNRTVSDILGPRGSKSKNLLLLQLAANLMFRKNRSAWI